jgi:hypothetical protein
MKQIASTLAVLDDARQLKDEFDYELQWEAEADPSKQLARAPNAALRTNELGPCLTEA